MATVTFKLLRPKGKTTPVSILCTYYYSSKLRVCNVATTLKILPDKWKNNKAEKMPRAEKINRHITEMTTRLLNIHIDYPDLSDAKHKHIATLIIKGKAIPKEDVNRKKTSLVSVYRFIAQYRRVNVEESAGKFLALAAHLKEFCNGERLDFSAIDQDFYERLRNFLWEQPNPIYKGYHLVKNDEEKHHVITKGEKKGQKPIGILDNTTYKYLKNVQQMARWLNKKKYDVSEFILGKEWKIVEHDTQPIALTNEELLNVESLALIGKLAIVRDYFVLACRTGQRISDIKKITKDNIHEDEIHLIMTKGNRNKTIHVKIPLIGYTSPAVKLLERYNYKLPRLNRKTLNARVKDICQMAGINKEMYIDNWQGGKKLRYYGPKYEFLSIHNGKKTFVTLLLSVDIPLSVISEITGTRYDTLLKHYKSVMNSKQLREQLKKTEHMLLREAI